MEKTLKTLENQISYQFEDSNLLTQALTHRSAGEIHNERLEFLGDAILSSIIAEELFQRQPDAKEGELSQMRAALVNGDILAKFGEQLQLGDYLIMAAGEERTGGRSRRSNLANAFEALIAALYLDAGFNTARQCVLTWYNKQFENLAEFSPAKDPKSALQEWLQANKLPLPDYTVTTTGKAHEQTFHVFCQIIGLPYQTEGVSHSRRTAEKIAAEKMLEKIHEHHSRES
jgi:ribonuclease-3